MICDGALARFWAAEHVTYNHAPTSRMIWQNNILFPVCACARNNSTLTLWKSLVFFVAILVVIVLDATTRDSLPDPNGDGDPGSPHHGVRVFWGGELVHIVSVFVLLYFFGTFVLAATTCYSMRDAARTQITEFDMNEQTVPRLPRLIWAAHSIALPASVTALIIYASCMTKDDRVSQLTTASYSLQPALMLFDSLFWNMPLLPIHVVWTLAAGWAYALFTVLYYLLAIDWDTKYPYIYNALDWSQPVKTLGNMLAISVLILVVHQGLVTWTLMRARFFNATAFQKVLPAPLMGLGAAKDSVVVVEAV